MPKSILLPHDMRLEYVEHGAPDGVPIIFLHGVTDSWRSFQGVLPLLPPDLRAFAISLRGHGESSRPASGYRLEDMAGDVLAFMDVLSIPAAIIVGHSMGAGVAQRMAADAPARVSALVLMGTFASFKGEGMREFVATEIRPLADPISREFAEAWQQSTLARPMDAAHFEDVIVETLKVPAYVWHAAFEGFLQTEDMVDRLRAFTAPVLLIWGERDAYTDREGQARLLAALPDARLVVHEHAGHALHWEDPARCAADMISFFQGAVRHLQGSVAAGAPT